MLLSQVNAVVITAVLLALGIFLIIVFVVFIGFFRPWLRAFLTGAPITLFQLIGMKLRRVNTNQVLTQGCVAAQAEYPIPWVELERAWLQRVDLEKVTLAYIACQKRDDRFTFQELVEAERDDRLDKLLKR
jgi:uncharacterized protein YqfA (UPF0365 family)